MRAVREDEHRAGAADFIEQRFPLGAEARERHPLETETYRAWVAQGGGEQGEADRG